MSEPGWLSLPPPALGNRSAVCHGGEDKATKVLRIVPKFAPPETYSESVARMVNPVLDIYSHVAIVDDDTSVPEEFFQLPDEYPNVDIIVPRVLPTSRIYRTWEALTYWLRLNPVRARGCAVIYSTEFLKRIGGYPSWTEQYEDTYILRKANTVVQYKKLIAYHMENFSLRKSIERQKRQGRARAKLHDSLWRVLAHSIVRVRPVLFFAYISQRTSGSANKVDRRHDGRIG